MDRESGTEHASGEVTGEGVIMVCVGHHRDSGIYSERGGSQGKL